MILHVFAGTIILMFLAVRFGWIKSWFVLGTLPGLLSARMIYAILPIGVGFSFLAVGASLPLEPKDEAFWVNSFFISCAFSLPFMIWPPKLIKPAWLQWLEREYGYCLDILIEEGQKMNRWEWEGRVRTQAGMQAWIDEVYECRQGDIDLCWFFEKIYLVREQMQREGRREPLKVGEQIKTSVPEHRRNESDITQADIDQDTRIHQKAYRKYRNVK